MVHAQRQRAQARRRHPRRARPALGGALARRQPGARTAHRPCHRLPAQGARRQVLRLPRRPHRHRPGQPRYSATAGGATSLVGERDPAPDRDGQPPDRRGEGGTGLQRTGAGLRGGRSAPHRRRRSPGGGGDNFDGHDTAIKGAVTDGLKRAFRSFGVQFGNAFYGDQPQVGTAFPQPASGNSGQAPSNGKSPGRPRLRRQGPRSAGSGDRRNESQDRKAAEAAHRDRRRAGPRRGPVCGRPSSDRTGKSLDDLDGRRAWSRWWRPPPTSSGRCSRPRACPVRDTGPPSPPVDSGSEWSGVVSDGGSPAPLIYRTTRRSEMTTNVTYTPWGWTQGRQGACRGRLAGLDAEPRRAEAQLGSGGTPFPPHCGTPCTPRPSPRRTARSPSSGRSWASATNARGRWR